jgi:hypothetical protein
MRRLAALLTPITLAATIAAIPTGGAGAAADHEWPVGGLVFAGASSRSVLPLVDGGHDYLDAGFPTRTDPYDPGIVVPQWDDGRIAVGNGDGVSYWVHDDLRVSALAVSELFGREIVVFVATDTYMIFRLDAEDIREKARAQLPQWLADRARIVVTASHNHHGPDTAFDINHDWYEYMTDQAASAVVDAIRHRRLATLRVAAGEHWFGQNDGTDPQILDPRLQVLQARDLRGRTIATAVQWNNHPEGTLGWEPPAEAIAEDCVVLGLTGDDCRAEGRYFTADYPGVLRDVLHERYGGEVLYFNGALGVLIGPGGAHVWEVDAAHPLGNQLVAPPGAVAAGGGTDYTQRNFRRTAIVGEQLAAAVTQLVDRARPIYVPKLSYAVDTFFIRLTNFGFRVLLSVDPATGFSQLGHNLAPLYTCPATGPKNAETCTSDNLESTFDELAERDVRVGDHFESAVEYVRIGPVGMMFLPGEIPGELTIGLPSQFRVTPELWYEEAPGLHAFGADYRTPGYVTRRMHDRYEWTIGLGSDELGYVIPISNFRVKCVFDDIFGAGVCQSFHDQGFIEFPDAVAGATCKQLVEDPDSSPIPMPERILVGATCIYGQAFGEAAGHYEETNSASWDLAAAMLESVGRLTGNTSPAQVNKGFPGWWQGHLPPG